MEEKFCFLLRLGKKGTAVIRLDYVGRRKNGRLIESTHKKRGQGIKEIWTLGFVYVYRRYGTYGSFK